MLAVGDDHHIGAASPLTSIRTAADYDVNPAVDHESASLKLAGRAPRFEDASGHSNVTVQLGGTAFLNCRVMDLQDKMVCFLTSIYLSYFKK